MEAKNKYYTPMPLDFRLLELMPEKAVIGGVHWAGRPARHIVEDINEGLPDGVPRVGINEVQARLRSMAAAGFVENFPAVSARVWARTADGSTFLKTKGAVLGA